MFDLNTPFSDLLSDYLNGSLSDEDMQQVESALKTDESLVMELAFLKQVSKSLPQDKTDFVPGEFGWAKLSRAIDLEDSQKALPLMADNDRSAHIGKAQETVTSFKHPQFWRYAAIALACVSIGQAALLTSGVLGDNDKAIYVPVSEPQAQTALPTVTITFMPTATESSIRKLIIAHNADIIAGPSALGLYTLQFETQASREQAVEAFQNQPDIVDAVEIN